VVPHGLVGLEASMILIQLAAAFKAVPAIAMGVEHAERRWSLYKSVAVNASEVLYHVAKILYVVYHFAKNS